MDQDNPGAEVSLINTFKVIIVYLLVKAMLPLVLVFKLLSFLLC